VLHEAETSYSRLPEPGFNSPRREGPMRTSERMKARAHFKVALKIRSDPLPGREGKASLGKKKD